MKVRLLERSENIEKAAAVLLELRPAYSIESLIDAVRDAQQNHHYQLACVESDTGDVLCVAGFVIGFKLAWGRHLYVDDLVTAAGQRSRGAGTAMLQWLKAFAREQGCRELHLDSGVQRYAAHRFYLREGFEIRSHHFSVIDLNDSQ